MHRGLFRDNCPVKVSHVNVPAYCAGMTIIISNIKIIIIYGASTIGLGLSRAFYKHGGI